MECGLYRDLTIYIMPKAIFYLPKGTIRLFRVWASRLGRVYAQRFECYKGGPECSGGVFAFGGSG